jgi:hypothetical protein
MLLLLRKADLVQELLRMGADLRAENDRKATALMFAAEYGQPAVVQLLQEAYGQPAVTADELLRSAKLAAHEEEFTEQPGSQHAAAFTRLAKELHRLYPTSVQQLFQDPNPVPVAAAIAALLHGWASDTSSIDSQRAAVCEQQQDVARERKAAQQLLLSMACMRKFPQQGHVQGVDETGCSRKRPRRDYSAASPGHCCCF